MFAIHHHRNLAITAFAVGLFVGCGESAEGPLEGPVDFTSHGAHLVRQAACAQDYENGARKGAGAEDYNASTLWSVSPYLVLVPSEGEGYVNVNVDAPHYDWLVYTTSDVDIESMDGPDLEYGGPVTECPELDLVEYGAHHEELTNWQLRMRAEPMSRAHFYAGLAATEHSDPEKAGHAGHDLTGDSDAPDHGVH